MKALILVLFALCVLASISSATENPDRQNVYVGGLLPYGDQSGIGFQTQITVPSGDLSWVFGWSITQLDIKGTAFSEPTTTNFQQVTFGAKFYF